MLNKPRLGNIELIMYIISLRTFIVRIRNPWFSPFSFVEGIADGRRRPHTATHLASRIFNQRGLPLTILYPHTYSLIAYSNVALQLNNLITTVTHYLLTHSYYSYKYKMHIHTYIVDNTVHTKTSSSSQSWGFWASGSGIFSGPSSNHPAGFFA